MTIPHCRICFENKHDDVDPLISPCECRGSQEWVHKSCLKSWITIRKNNQKSCPTCKSAYRYSKRMSYIHDVLCPNMILVIILLIITRLLFHFYRSHGNESLVHYFPYLPLYMVSSPVIIWVYLDATWDGWDTVRATVMLVLAPLIVVSLVVISFDESFSMLDAIRFPGKSPRRSNKRLRFRKFSNHK